MYEEKYVREYSSRCNGEMDDEGMKREGGGGGDMGIKGQAWRRNKFLRGASVSGRDNGNVNGSGRDL